MCSRRASSPTSTCAACSARRTDGRYWFRGVKPRFYPIPDDGPVGQLLGSARPASLPAGAPAYHRRGRWTIDRLTTHIFDPDDPYIASDAVFGVKESLLARFELVDDPERAAQLGVANPFYDVEFDFALAKARPPGAGALISPVEGFADELTVNRSTPIAQEEEEEIMSWQPCPDPLPRQATPAPPI